MVDFGQVRQGLVVFSADGKRLGKVVSVASSSFQVEKGVLFPRDFLVMESQVSEVSGETVVLSTTAAQLREGGGYGDYGYADRKHAGDARVGPEAGVGAGLAAASPHQDAVRLAQSQADAGRTDAGIAGDGGRRDEVLGGLRREDAEPSNAPAYAAQGAQTGEQRSLGAPPDDAPDRR
jgi:hypothetical protein